MCGIVGIYGIEGAVSKVLSGLRYLEYRGYDSSGISFFSNSEILTIKAQGKLIDLESKILTSSHHAAIKDSTLAIGHTRWATHGKPSEANAHPHQYGRVSLVHNGIIENHQALRNFLKSKIPDLKFESETDTEVVAVLLDHYLHEFEPLTALRKTLTDLEGAYSIAAIVKGFDGILVAKQGSPLIVGVCDGGHVLASDIPAILPHTPRLVILEDGDLGIINKSLHLFDVDGATIERDIQVLEYDPIRAQKGGFKHFFIKEIHEQPTSVSYTIGGLFNHEQGKFALPDIDLGKIKRILILGCGSAYYAGMVGKYLLEKLNPLNVDVEIASEYRYRKSHTGDDTLVLAISQSGETADTLGAVKAVKNCYKIALCNSPFSSLTREVDFNFNLNAGPEISVASSKAFMSQVVALVILSLHLYSQGKPINEHYRALSQLSKALKNFLHAGDSIEKLSQRLYKRKSFFFIGRDLLYPIALEGALKLKELSYIHAEGFAAGEIKHGPLSLLDENTVTIVLLQKEEPFYSKTCSNIQEVKARGTNLVIITDSDYDGSDDGVEEIIRLESLDPLIAPALFVVPLQLLAYHIAVLNGTDVDLPRNLAKSVTVE